MLKRLLLSNSSLYFFALPILALSVVYFSFATLPLKYNQIMAVIPLKSLHLLLSDTTASLIFWSFTTILGVLFIPMLASRFGMFERGIYQASIFWLSLIPFYIFTAGEFQPLLAAVLTLPIFYFLFGMYKSEFSSHLLFNASILISAISLFYIPTLISVSLIWIGWLMYNPFNFRTFILSLLGLTIPYLFAFSYYYLTDNLESLENVFKYTFNKDFPVFSFKWYLYFGLVGLFSLAGIIRLMRHGFVKKIGIRKNFTLLTISILLYSGLFVFLRDPGFIAFALFPVSMMINLHFTNINRTRIYEILFLILVGLMLFIPYLPEKI